MAVKSCWSSALFTVAGAIYITSTVPVPAPPIIWTTMKHFHNGSIEKGNSACRHAHLYVSVTDLKLFFLIWILQARSLHMQIRIPIWLNRSFWIRIWFRMLLGLSCRSLLIKQWIFKLFEFMCEIFAIVLLVRLKCTQKYNFAFNPDW